MLKPVIFIPGVPGSELRDSNNRKVFPPSPGTLLDDDRKQAFFEAMLDIPGDLVAGPPIRSVLNLAKQAESLYEILADLGYTIANEGASNDFAPIGWDWRLGIDAKPTMDAIAKAIDDFAPRKVVPLVHSTGVLVLRAFLDAHPEMVERIDQVLAFGGAWCGTLDAFFAAHDGRSQSILGINLITQDEGANLFARTQTAYDLFPPDPTRTPGMEGVQLVHGADGLQASANVDLSWIKPDRVAFATPLAQKASQRLGARSREFGLRLTNVVGWGAPTIPTCVLGAGDVHFLPEEKDAGDGTVPLASAQWIQGPNVRTIVVPIGAFVADPIPDRHAHMWDSLAVNQVFKELFVPGTVPREFIAAAADSDEAIDLNSGAVTIRMTAQTNDGRPLPDCIATVTLKGKGAKIPVPFQGRTRASLRLNRQGITHNLSKDIFQFRIDFKWNGGSRDNVAVSFRAP